MVKGPGRNVHWLRNLRGVGSSSGCFRSDKDLTHVSSFEVVSVFRFC